MERGYGEVVCSGCGAVFKRRVRDFGKYSDTCRSCDSKKKNLGRNLSGSRNHLWKGGHKYYLEGRHGRDKDGLSWKIQRKLAWERDGLKCVECGKKSEFRRPDVHHVVPYRISKSHALDNLKSLCKRCHKKEDLKL
jgi:hypothetical protein